MTDLIRFRCTRCNTSLKVSGAKAGTRVACPKCNLELTIPQQGGDGAVVEVATSAAVIEEPVDLAAPPGGGFLNLDLRLEPTTATTQSASAAKPSPVAQPAKPAVPASTTTSPSTSTSMSGESGLLRVERPSLRSRDVVLPRTAVVAYSTFALLGLLCAFLTGLLIGHFVWR